MTMIVKYKLIDGKIPTNIVDGGYFVVGDYLIGKGVDLEQQVLTQEELTQQVLLQHQTTPYINMDSRVELTEQEVTNIVLAWCNNRGE